MKDDKYVQGIVALVLLVVVCCLILAGEIKSTGSWMLVGMAGGVTIASFISAFRK